MRKLLFGGIIASLMIPIPSNAAEVDLDGFVRSLVNLKTVGSTCSSAFSTSPTAYLTEVDKYFQVLGQPVPKPEDPAAKRSISKLVKQHAAYVCSEKLRKAYANYARNAVSYMQNKPEQWPPAPKVSFPNWCSDAMCSNYQ